MPRPARNLPLNTSGLEADVMRFMAIIAFCLIAIMALVKKIEPTGALNEIKTNATLPIPEVERSPGAEAIPNAASLPNAVNRAQPLVVRRDDVRIAAPRTLTLRFDSDRTFLHLIATNSLRLYASTVTGFLGMDSEFNVTQSSPPGELYEVMHESIPRKITRSFNRYGDARVYLVALPAITTQDLAKFLGSTKPHSSGALVIHRDGHISHES